MKILVFSRSAWDDTNSFGNTVSNFFGGREWSSDEFLNIYMRNALPDNKICKKYYRFTIQELIKNYFKKEFIGTYFEYIDRDQNKDIAQIKNEKKLIDFIHLISLNVVYYIAETISAKEWWNNEKFRDCIRDFQPDIFFSFLDENGVESQLIRYVKKHTKAKVILFAADDVYNDFKNHGELRKKLEENGFKYSLMQADILYGASVELCNKYEQMFSVSVIPLYKGCEFKPIKTKVNDVIRIVYAGNLFWGRENTLLCLVEVIKKINRQEQRVKLEIYTNSTITEKNKQKLNVKGCSEIKGSRSFDEIKEILHKSDIVLHVESFDKKQIECVKYSFSTKIIDCLQSGSMTLGIGPSGIASMEYLKKIDGTMVINEILSLEDQLRMLINNREEILVRAGKIRDFAVKNHDVCDVRMKLHQDFEEVITR